MVVAYHRFPELFTYLQKISTPLYSGRWPMTLQLSAGPLWTAAWFLTMVPSAVTRSMPVHGQIAASDRGGPAGGVGCAAWAGTAVSPKARTAPAAPTAASLLKECTVYLSGGFQRV